MVFPTSPWPRSEVLLWKSQFLLSLIRFEECCIFVDRVKGWKILERHPITHSANVLQHQFEGVTLDISSKIGFCYYGLTLSKKHYQCKNSNALALNAARVTRPSPAEWLVSPAPRSAAVKQLSL